MLTEEQASIVKGLLERQEKQHDIAAFFAVNGGRIAEIRTGTKFSDVKPAAAKSLPTKAELAGGWQLFYAREALRRSILSLQTALDYLNQIEVQRDFPRQPN